MDTKKDIAALESIPANRDLVGKLYHHGKITKEARDYALDFLYPRNRWGLIISRLLLILGSALALSGIIFFFAYNWSKLPRFTKLGAVELGVLLCLACVFYRSLDKLSGKTLLLSASVLVGVFFAVYGQIYQTGADAYELFLAWSVLIFGWVLVSEFAALWLLWLVVVNTFIVLFWKQVAQPSQETLFMIFTYLMLFNGIALALKEYFTIKGFEWLNARWLRLTISICLLIMMLIPIIALIVSPDNTTDSIVTGAITGSIGHFAIYIFYRYKLPDIWPLAASVLSVCIIAETAAIKILAEALKSSDAAMFLLMGIATIIIFATGVILLRRLSNRLESEHA